MPAPAAYMCFPAPYSPSYLTIFTDGSCCPRCAQAHIRPCLMHIDMRTIRPSFYYLAFVCLSLFLSLSFIAHARCCCFFLLLFVFSQLTLEPHHPSIWVFVRPFQAIVSFSFFFLSLLFFIFRRSFSFCITFSSLCFLHCFVNYCNPLLYPNCYPVRPLFTLPCSHTSIHSNLP